VFTSFPEPAYMPCAACGASVARLEDTEHRCEHDRWLAYQVFLLGEEISRFDAQLTAYFESLSGRFDIWYAERDRNRPA
jgi:hypothetical protein